MKSFEIERCESLPPRDDLNGVLTQYYDLLEQRMGGIGVAFGPAEIDKAFAEFWANAGDYLPPNGCLVLARDNAGTVIGCGMMKRLDPETGELKRVFVTEAARGTGAGRALIEAREAAARDMGLTRLVADTLTPNVEMRGLYPKLGFTEVDGSIETTTYLDQPMLRPHLHYFVKEL